MTPQRRTALWGLGIVSGLSILALGIYFTRLGLERANSLAGILGLFVGIIGLVLTFYSILQARGGAQSPSPQQVRMSQQSGSNSTNVQSARDINIGDNNKLGGS
ncbi:hypothetical protein [Streptomyces sp. VNUA74]|uniref:hypothetical protein n=1 Tax=Streptomyces sp. VNUA74 TaxID=3062685 RepID=UPI00280ABEF3|nr:hypothetical protein [Streptomyces sp. VNUA74]WML79787.1 hypothetical protein Q3101_07995 [Streptomyces sp. VNUA74]